MKIDSLGYQESVAQAAAQAIRAERDGYDTWWATETKADPFLECLIAAEQTERIGIRTGIAVAFARNPMTVAVQANDVHAYSQGRFELGLGAQLKAHITRRYAMPYDHPTRRMREFVLAIRAIWDAWANGTRLQFDGEFYSHTLMTPMFDPGPNPHGNPPIFVAAVGPLMTEVAAEVADGVVLHGLCTEWYLRAVMLPALGRGAAKAGRSLDGFDINMPGFIAVYEDEAQRVQRIAKLKAQIGFYASTPTYRRVLTLHGWEAEGEELTAMSTRGEWGRLRDLITDEMLNVLAITGTPDEVAPEIERRYGDIATRIVLPGADEPEASPQVRDALRAAGVL